MSLWAHLEFSDLVRHSSSGSGDQYLDSVHASTEIIIHTNGLRQAGTSLGYPNTEIMALQKGTFSLLKRSGTPGFHGWCGRRRTLIQGWISSKGAGVAQDALEKTQQSCVLVGEGGKSCLQQDVPFCRGRWWQLGWGKEKKMQGSTLCGKRSLSCLPQPARPRSHPTGHCSSQPTLQEGLTAHSPLPLGNLHPSTSGLAPGMKKQQLFPWRGGQRKKWGRQWLHLPAPAGPQLSIIRSHMSGMILQLPGSIELLPLQGECPTWFEWLFCLLNSLLFSLSFPLVSGKKRET